MLLFVGPLSDIFETTLNAVINLWNHDHLINIIRIDNAYIVFFNNTNPIIKNLYRHLCKNTDARFIINAHTYYTITLKESRPWVINAPFPKYPCLFYKGHFVVDYITEVTEGHIKSKL